MKIISRHNKKDFYDYSGFGHDTSDDIVFVRIPKTEELDEHNKIKDYFNKRIPYSDSWNIKNYFVTYVIVGIYPYCYIIPTIVNNYENLLTQGQVIVPFEVADTNEEVNEFLKKINSNIQIESKYKWLSEHRRHSNFKPSWKDEDLFRQIETPVFLFHHKGTYENHHFKSYDYIIKNIIFTEQPTNWLKYIKDDLDKRDVYTDIENYLWSMKQEPISEPDNETKIISHGFDLKTSFRKM